MLKLLGATIIVVSSTMGGLYISKSYSERPRQLRAMQQALQMLETEIVYGAVPLDLAMKHIGDRLSGTLIKNFFIAMSANLKELDGASTYECWRAAINRHFGQTSMKAQDKEILLQFGQTLGISDREDQMKHIKLAIQNLATEESLAREDQVKYEKLSRSLGVLVGLLIAILIY